MITPEVVTYIKNQRTQGVPDEQIKAALKQQGWQDAHINAAMSASPDVPIPPARHFDEESSTTSTVVTILLLMFMPLIGIIVMWIWPKWKKSVKVVITTVFATLLVVLLSLVLIVFGSLNTAREKGNAAAVKANLSSIRVNAELYWEAEGNGTYGSISFGPEECNPDLRWDSFLSSEEVRFALEGARGAYPEGSILCALDAEEQTWAISAELPGDDNAFGDYYCIDSEGSHNMNSPITSTSCM
jgi:hypothetical protein